jgi:hypothetical protein
MISSENLLAIAEALNTIVAETVPFAIPSPLPFKDKADLLAVFDSTKDTRLEIDTDLITAAWLKYMRFEDDDREKDGATRTLIYELTVFSEGSIERLDQTLIPDEFDKRVRRTNHEHVTAVMAIVGSMQSINPVPALAMDFAVAETITPAQNDFTQTDVECAYVPGMKGDQTKLELRVRVQLPC